jgi:flagellar hook-associated protein 3 FlgL
MTRVSENNSTASLNHAINRVKTKLENLQIKGSNLKKITKPSDNPISNVEALGITSITNDNKQYLKNINFALLQLSTTESSLEQINDILLKAKEIAIAQASDFYGQEIRQNVANEVIQMRNQILAIANQRIGNKYIFSGYSTLTRPFDTHGNYYGDDGKITLEISKDFFVPINLNGVEVFFSEDKVPYETPHPLKEFPALMNNDKSPAERNELINARGKGEISNPKKSSQNGKQMEGLFSQLSLFIAALNNNDSTLIQDLIPDIDNSISKIITLRTRVGSLYNSVRSSFDVIEKENILNAEQKSNLVDADIAELFADIIKQQEILKTTYQTGKSTLNENLLDFLR